MNSPTGEVYVSAASQGASRHYLRLWTAVKAKSEGAVGKVLAQTMRPGTRTNVIQSYGIGHQPDALHKAMTGVGVQHCQ